MMTHATWKRRWKTDAELRDVNRRDAATISVPQPPDATGQDVGKSAPNVTTPPKGAIFGKNEPRDANGHDVEKPMLRVARQKASYLAKVNLEIPLDTTLETNANRSDAKSRDAARRRRI
jgi:hypothetical protein